MTYGLWQDAQNSAMKELKSEFEHRTLEAADQVRRRMVNYDQMLQGLRGLFTASVSVERNEFHGYCAALNLGERFKGVQGLSYLPLVPNSKKAAHITAVRRAGFPGYTLQPEGQRERYTPVLYIEPFSGSNLRAFGFDVSSEPVRRTALDQARDTNSAVITGNLDLIQDSDQTQSKSAGFLMLLPLYTNGLPHDTLQQRRANTYGWLSAVFRVEELMAGVLGEENQEIDIEIFDGAVLSKSFLLYDKDKIYRAGHLTNQLFQHIQQLKIAGRIWTIRLSSLPAFEKHLNSHKSEFFALGGIIVSLLLALMTWILARDRIRSLRTSHLLSHELQSREAAEESLKLASMVYENSSEGILVADAENRIIAVNPAFTRITGYDLTDVQDKDPSHFRSGRHGQDFYEAMWAELKRIGHWQGEIWDRHKNGEVHAKYVTINTIFNEKGAVYRRVALFMDISDKKETEELIWRQANFDPLTALPNRSMFHDRLMQEISRADRSNHIFALLFIDLDLFKEVNDTLGHYMGDLLLQDAAKRILNCVRQTDTVARLGGDEFTVILSELSDTSSIEGVATKILANLAAPYTLGDEVVYITGSIGITLYPADVPDADGLLKNLLKNADQAMYVAKNLGRNRIGYFTHTMQETAQARLHMITDMREAITTKQFVVHYQPIVDLSTGAIYKAEALVRWQHPIHGLVPPNDFIPLAEETGLINDIGDWVFREAARETQRLRGSHHPSFQISVNKSPTQFRDSGHTIASWLEHLRELNLPGDAIVIEITEGLLLNAVSDVTHKLQLLRDGGIHISIDDFGTGYSSLSYLKRFHIDYLKIDQSFVHDIETDPNDMALSNAIIVMAHALGLKVIAEGVETAEQLKLLTNAGCDYAQGYFFTKPISANEFEAWLHQRKPVTLAA
jgi:diguanylate cyclase (GGDEF)-like protein/PAS domain S-box-containing protein